MIYAQHANGSAGKVLRINAEADYYQIEGVGFTHVSNLVSIIDWTKALELDDGTPVLPLCTTSRHALLRLPAQHPCQPHGSLEFNAQLSTGLVTSNHRFHVRNRKMIDTTKPLRVTSPHSCNPVQLVASTKDDCIIVERAPGAVMDSGWLVFNLNGTFVRSSTGGGSALRLENVPEPVIKTHQADVGLGDGTPLIKIEITTTDGKPTGVRLVGY